jgi:hypothetical protein
MRILIVATFKSLCNSVTLYNQHPWCRDDEVSGWDELGYEYHVSRKIEAHVLLNYVSTQHP